MRMPFDGEFPITQEFGENPDMYSKFNMKGHNGMDWGVPTGTEILAPFSGTVIEARYDASGYGIYVKIEDSENGATLGHFEGLRVNVGDVVTEGQLVGISDNTGNSTGPHLHFGLYKIPRDRTNGYDGYINQRPLLESLGLLQPLEGFPYASTANVPVGTVTVVGSPEYYEGIDLNNKESIKVCVDTWKQVTEGKFVSKAQYDEDLLKHGIIIQGEMDKQFKEKEAELAMLKDVVARYESQTGEFQALNDTTVSLNEKIATLTTELNNLTNAHVELQQKYQIVKNDYQTYKDQIANTPVTSTPLPENMVDVSVLAEAKNLISDLHKLVELQKAYKAKDVPGVFKALQDIVSVIMNFHLMFKSAKPVVAEPVEDKTLKVLGY